MTNVTAEKFYSFAYVRGADQEWSGAFKDSPSATGDIKEPGDGFRHFGNMKNHVDKPVGSTRPANVWVHDFTSDGQSDGALQIAPGCGGDNDDLWSNDSAENYLYENSNVKADPGTMILVGYSGAVLPSLHCTDSHIKDVTIRNITGSSTGSGILVYAAGLVPPPGNPVSQCSACYISNVTIENVTIDQTGRPELDRPDARVGGAFAVRGLDSTPVNDVTLRNIRVIGTAYTCFDVSALPASGIVLDRITCDAPRLDDLVGHVANATIRATTGVTITNSTIGSRSSAALEIGPEFNTGNLQTQRVNGGNYNVQNIYLEYNQFTGVASGQAGVLFRNSAYGKMYRSPVTKAGGAPPTTYGVILSGPLTPDPGARNNEVRANNLLGVDQGVVCGGQNNWVSGNDPHNLTANCP